MEMLDQLASDCRKEIRAEVCKRGRLVTSWQQYGILVMISDVSRFGARIKLDSPTKLPPTFELWIDDEQVVHPSRICWRLHNQIGVEFTGHARAMTKVLACGFETRGAELTSSESPVLRSHELAATDDP